MRRILLALAILTMLHVESWCQSPLLSLGDTAAAIDTTNPVFRRTVAVTVTSPKDLDRTLIFNGIRPDAASESYIYELNPHLSSISDIRGKTTIVIPQNIDTDAPVPIVVDQGYKQSIQANTTALMGASTEQIHSPAIPNESETITEAAKNLSTIDGHLADAPSSSLLLSQTARESSLLVDAVSEGSHGESDPSWFHAIVTDLELKAGWLGSDKNDPDVRVRAISPADGKAIALLTVCFVQVIYQPNGCDNSFERPTSDKDPPTDRRLPVANYEIWGQDALGHRRTELKKLEVRADIDLTLLVTQ